MGFLKSIVKLAGFAKFGWAGGLLADKNPNLVAGGLDAGLLGGAAGVKGLLDLAAGPDVSTQQPAPIGAPQRSAQFVDRRDPFNRDDFAEFSLRRDLDQFRIPLVDLFSS